MHKTYLDDGPVIIAVHLKKGVKKKDIVGYLKTHDVRYDVAIDRDDAVRAAYGVRTIPRFFVIDQDGTVVWEGRSVEKACERAIAEHKKGVALRQRSVALDAR